MRTLRVQVICEDSTAFLGSRNGKWADASEHVGNNILRLEQLYQTIVLGVQSRIPVNFGKVESKPTVRLMLFKRTS